jgi:hypothetical protein
LAPATGEGAEQNKETFDKNLSEIAQTEFRVSRVAFLDSATALVTVRLYYAGTAWSGVKTPTTALAEKVDGEWRISQADLCTYSRAGGEPCAAGDGPSGATFVPPPNGWNAADSVPGLADAFRVLAEPTSNVDQRVGAVDRGDQLRDAIEAGAKADAARAGTVSFVVSGTRLIDLTHGQVLYSVIADSDPHLETPYPLVGNAVLVDGRWRVASRFACGLNALATLSCPAAAALPTTTTSATTTSMTKQTPMPTTGIPTTVVPTTVAPTTDPGLVEVPTTRVVP